MVGVIAILGFSQCGSSQKLIGAKEAPFRLGEVRSEAWTLANNSLAKGTNLFFPLEDGKQIMLDSVYYQGRATKLKKIKRDSYVVFIGVFEDPVKPDMIMHEDATREAGNMPPPLRAKIPFELKDDEAVVSFKEGDVVKYLKVTGIMPSTPVEYPKEHLIKNER